MSKGNKKTSHRTSFSSSIGFVLAAAGSAVGLGNIWRFPYLAAKDGGGLFLLMYIVLALTFGFTLLSTELAIGRKTKSSPLTAYKKLSEKWGFLGLIASIVPAIILPYYCVIGGWVVKYFVTFLTGDGVAASQDDYFTGFITSNVSPIIFTAIFLAAVIFVVYRGVNKGIENFSKIVMPILLVLVLVIAVYSLTIRHETADGVVRTGFDGLKVYVIPDFEGMTVARFFNIMMDAMGQLFYSLSIAMGIMIAYGSYVRDEDNMMKSINQIEIFDTVVAFLAGVMIIPAVYTFMGAEGMQASGPSLMFVSLPKVFKSMGFAGNIIGCLFFAMVIFAALTSAISVMEAVVASLMDKFHISRLKAVVIESVIVSVAALVVCFGYNIWYFELKLPNGSVGQILDLMDYISNYFLMPIVAIGTCILIGWVLKPETVIDEIEKSGCKFGRRKLYIGMIKVVAPILLVILLLISLGIING